MGIPAADRELRRLPNTVFHVLVRARNDDASDIGVAQTIELRRTSRDFKRRSLRLDREARAACVFTIVVREQQVVRVDD